MKKYINGKFFELTPEEIEEMKKAQAEMTDQKPTPEERLSSVEQRTDTLESATDDMILLMADLIGGN